ncbi:MBL fold metallo-hydrolase [Streptomyces sp. NPDC058457]|uniref:MBL fold metallo-hydrolase n=1 Tax=Streptomyces sp. NPDC058457 TaxID=3346507 RepID=UPI003657E26B
MIGRRSLIRRGGAAAGALALGTGAGAGLVTAAPASAASGSTGFLPLPEHVKPLPDTGDGYRLERVGRNGYVLVAGIVQCVFVVTREGVVLVDAPPAARAAIRAAIPSVTDKPVTHVIYSHDHADHIGAVGDHPGATLIAHKDCAALLAAYADPARPVPHRIIRDHHKVIHIGGEEIHFIYPGPNHETGNMMIYFPRLRLAHMADVVMPGWAPYRAWGNADNIPGLLTAHDAILDLDFDTFCGGHVYRTATRAEVAQSREFFVDMWSTTVRKSSEISSADAAAGVAEKENVWAVQKVWIDRIAQSVTSELIDRWGTRIAAVDTFTPDCVGALVVSTFTDAPVNFP